MSSTIAGISTKTIVKGRVVSFNERSVQLKMGSERYLIPKEYFPSNTEFKEGLNLSLELSQEQSKKMIRQSVRVPRKDQ